MRYIHYWHFNKKWFVRQTESPTRQRVYLTHEDNYCGHYDQHLIHGSDGLTERQIRERITALFPDGVLVKDKPFHEGNRWFGYKHGSRY
jgi:hypothetical protein